jgi:hypothetical protein
MIFHCFWGVEFMVVEGPKGFVIGIAGCLGIVVGTYYLGQCMTRSPEETRDPASVQQPAEKFQRRSAGLREFYAAQDAGVDDAANDDYMLNR